MGGKTKTSGKFFKAMIDYHVKRKKSNEEVFVKDSLYSRTHLKKRIITENILPYICVECNNEGSHNNKPLVLHLDHINGDCFDNRLENLRFLCPNCHTQQETYSRGQKQKSNKQRMLEIKNAGVV